MILFVYFKVALVLRGEECDLGKFLFSLRTKNERQIKDNRKHLIRAN